jgi:hypothetical protein
LQPDRSVSKAATVVHRPEPPDTELEQHPPRLAKDEVRALLELSRTRSPEAGVRMPRLVLFPAIYAVVVRAFSSHLSWPLMAFGLGGWLLLSAWEIRRWRESTRPVDPPTPSDPPPPEPPELP